MVPINRPLLGREEEGAVIEVIRSGILTNASPEGGPNSRAFEGELAGTLKAKHCIVANSGTAALQIALMAAGIGEGDEVIVPSFTFIATASAVLLCGAKPVFVDIDPETYNLNASMAESAITDRTKAIMPVDLYGLPANFDEMRRIARDRDIALIEDACQAQGASYQGKMAGTLGDIGCFSFYAGKVMTTGEGGALITNDDDLAEKARRIRTHGQIKGYDSARLGGNFRMPEIEAAIGREQLKKLKNFLSIRAENARMMMEGLERTDLKLPEIPKGSVPNWYLFTVRCQTNSQRERLKKSLNEAGIGATVYYPTPVHRTPLYARMGYSQTKLEETERAAETVLSLPVNPVVTKGDIENMVRIIRNEM